MDRETILALITKWREQAEYSYSIGDMGAGRAWNEAADELKEGLD